MKKKVKSHDEDMAAEYDFSKGIRGKYSEKYKLGSNVVVLDPDVASVFKDSRSVNQVLRPLVSIIQQKH